MADDDEPGPWGRALTDADIAAAQLAKARAFLQARNADAAIREASAVLQQTPDGIWAYWALDVIGDAHWLRDQHAEVIEIGYHMLAIDPERVHGYVQLARGALEKKDMRVAIKAINDGLAKDPNSVTLMIYNSVRLRTAQDHPNAIAWARKAVALEPEDPHVHNNLARALTDGGQRAEALGWFETARQLDPLAEATMSAAAIDAFDANQFKAARQLALKALQQNPEDTAARQVAFRSRIFGNPLMAPFWWLSRIDKLGNTGFAMAFLLAILATAGLIILPVGRLFVGAAVGYALVCWFVVLLVGHIDRSTKPPKPPTLKNY
jgi:Tfp pilus assembly protein PilF